MAQDLAELASAFRQHLPDLTSPRFTTANQQSPYEYTAAFEKNHVPPWLFDLTETWKELLAEPFVGITTDGIIRKDVFQDEAQDIPDTQVYSAVRALLDQLSPSQTSQLRFPVNAREWRAWSNPEFLLRPLGLRLEELSSTVAQSIHSIIKASFSPEGYAKALAAMRINHFLGEICDVPRIMNEGSYNFLLFGELPLDNDRPSSPWGWSLCGHHLCLNVFFTGAADTKTSNIIISPTFTGAEPNIIDRGPHAGTQILQREGQLGLALMQSLPAAAQAAAQIYTLLRDPAMLRSGDLKVDRWNRDDQRHLCGAFRDNRVVPYEGVLVSMMTARQQELVMNITEEFLLYYPVSVRARRKETIRKWFHETWFCWIGGFGDDDAFYYRVQSPVVIFEFDHHSGVFLTNEEPAKFHTHTIMRTPNGGDYGQAWRRPEHRIP